MRERVYIEKQYKITSFLTLPDISSYYIIDSFLLHRQIKKLKYLLNPFDFPPILY